MSFIAAVFTSLSLAASGPAALPPLPTAAAASAVQQQEVVLSGTFEGREGKRGSGTARIIREGGKLYLDFEDFRSSRGPQLEVWIAGSSVTSNADAQAVSYVDLGALQGARQRTQRYELPADFDLENAASVVIWCEPFGILFASADLS